MTATIDTPIIATATAAPGTPDLLLVRTGVVGCADMLVRALAQTELDDPRWLTAGPLVSEAADLLRAAFGRTPTRSTGPVPSVVRESDLVHAMGALHEGRPVVDADAASEFLRAASAATVALG